MMQLALQFAAILLVLRAKSFAAEGVTFPTAVRKGLTQPCWNARYKRGTGAVMFPDNETIQAVVKEGSIRGAFSKEYCQVFYAFSKSEESDYEYDYSRACQTLAAVGDKNRGREFGPWCFTRYKFAYNEPLWEPCYPSCTHVQKENEPFNTCFWTRDLPLNRMQSYVANNKKIRYMGQPVNGVECMDWSNTKITDALKAAVAEEPEMGQPRRTPERIYTELGSESNCRALPLPRESFASPANRRHHGRELLRPWCFLSNSTAEHMVWHYCVDVCEDIAKCIPRQEAAVFDYLGEIKESLSGSQCQSWSSNRIAHICPRDKSDSNFCRNFDHQPAGPFCIVRDDKTRHHRPEPCLPLCEDNEDVKLDRCVGPDKWTLYTGTRSRTIGNLTCQRWDSHSPHPHHYSARSFDHTDLWMVSNYCRNPNAHPDGPWCFTTDASIEWQPCFRKCREDELEAKSTLSDKINKEQWLLDVAAANKRLSERKISRAEWSSEDTKEIFIYIGSLLAVFVVIVFFAFLRKNCASCAVKNEGVVQLLIDVRNDLEAHKPGIREDGVEYAASDKEYEAYYELMARYREIYEMVRQIRPSALERPEFVNYDDAEVYGEDN